MKTFTPDNPPKSGKPKKLWAWWIACTGNPPSALWFNRELYRYQLEAQGGRIYSIGDVEAAIKSDPKYARRIYRVVYTLA